MPATDSGRPKRVLVVGEINVDLICQGYHAFPQPGREVLVDDFQMVLGSASAICAMGLARLGTPVAFFGKVGDDPTGHFCLDAMRGRGIDLDAVVLDPSVKTGVTVAITSPTDRALVSYLGSIAALREADVPRDLFRRADHVHVSSYYLQEALRPGVAKLLRDAQGAGLTTSLDPGFDPKEGWEPDLRETLAYVDVFFPNEVELRALSGTDDPEEAVRRLQKGRTRIVAKLGAQGALAIEDGRTVRVPAPRGVAVTDTTGAGDSFNAGFLHAWLGGAALADCLRLGVACGSLSTRGLGGTATQADLAEARALLEKP
ncbi:MAG TPA: carbohydrate kinase family protein [Thermoanaerobaculia bacterium]